MASNNGEDFISRTHVDPPPALLCGLGDRSEGLDGDLHRVGRARAKGSTRIGGGVVDPVEAWSRATHGILHA